MLKQVVILCALIAGVPSWAAEDGKLIGLWGSRVVMPAVYTGLVTITALDGGVNELCVDGQCKRWKWNETQGDTYRFELPNFGTVVTQRDGTTHWLQPAAATYNGWATPIRLETKGSRAAGRVAPYTESRTFYLRVDRGEDGQLRAFVRNPERNFGNRMLTTATVDGDVVRFFNSVGAAANEGRFVEDGQGLLMTMYQYGTIALRKLKKGEPAIGFDPRTNSAIDAKLHRPWPDQDWSVADPADVNLRADLLSELLAQIAGHDVTDVSAPAVHSVLVARNGKLVFEEYFAGHDVDTLHDTRSSGKSLGTMLVGAMGVDPKITLCESAPWAKAQCAADPRRARIQLKHLITMSTGLACDDDNIESPGNEDTMQNQSEQPDWYSYIVSVPMQHLPGEKGAYCSAGINLSGAILSAKGKAEVYQLFDRYLARPLNINRYHMNLDPAGHGYLGGGIRIRPRDMLKFGEVMRTGGTWKGKRILAESWVKDSFAAHASLNQKDDYGYGWWRQAIDVEERSIQTYYASGNGGQLLFVIPELDMTVLFMGGNYGNYGTWRQFRDVYLAQYILKAAMKSKP